MKKAVSFVWDDACQKAYEDIKAHLTKPPVLASPVSRKSFLLYVIVRNYFLGVLLTQKNDGAEQAIYYLSKILIGAESRYNPLKKECLALVFTIQKMRHYLVRQTIHIILRISSSDPYNKAKFSELQVDWLDHTVVLIWHDLRIPEGHQGTNPCRLLSNSSQLI